MALRIRSLLMMENNILPSAKKMGCLSQVITFISAVSNVKRFDVFQNQLNSQFPENTKCNKRTVSLSVFVRIVLKFLIQIGTRLFHFSLDQLMVFYLNTKRIANFIHT